MDFSQNVDTRKLNSFDYQRFELSSAMLGAKVHWGRAFVEGLSPDQIEGTLYVCHGGNGDDLEPLALRLLENLSQDVVTALFSKRIQIVFPWIGASFLRSAGSADDTDWSRYFWSEVVPAVEASPRHGESSRWISGYSMGGQSALNLFLRDVRRFSGVGVHFATLIDFDYLNEQESEAFARRNRVSEASLKILREGFSTSFRNREHFQAHNPLSLLETVDVEQLRGRTIYFDVGSDDDFGLAEGARLLSSSLRERSVDHSFFEIPGGKHDALFLQQRFSGCVQAMIIPANDKGRDSRRASDEALYLPS